MNRELAFVNFSTINVKIYETEISYKTVYNPRHFRVSDKEQMRDFVRKYSFGTIFSGYEGKSFTSHIPMLINDECTELTGHLAIENDHWKILEDKEVLVEFVSPSHYISPVWYGLKGVVPTWNYGIVQIKGIFNAVKEWDDKIRILDELVSHFEAEIGGSWSTDWNDEHFASMTERIVAMRISINSIEGKWKMSQNYPEESRKKVEEALKRIGSDSAEQVAEMMTKFNK